MKSKIRCALLILALTGNLSAHAGIFSDDEARKRIDVLQTDIKRLGERIDHLETLSRNSLELANQIEALKAEIAKLRGQSEVLSYELESLQKRQKDFYLDLDTRLRKLEVAAAPVESPKSVVDPAVESKSYEAALNLFKLGKYKDATAAFEAFIKTYPDSAFQPSAHYWIASAHYQASEYKQAVEFFSRVSAQWPNDPKAPDAMLGRANSLQEAGDAKGAKQALEALVGKYPDSSAAQVAKQRLAPPKKKK